MWESPCLARVLQHSLLRFGGAVAAQEKGTDHELTMRGLSNDQQKELGAALASPFPEVAEAENTVEFSPRGLRRDPEDDDELADGNPSVRRQLDRNSELRLARHFDDTYQGSLRAGD